MQRDHMEERPDTPLICYFLNLTFVLIVVFVHAHKTWKEYQLI